MATTTHSSHILVPSEPLGDAPLKANARNPQRFLSSNLVNNNQQQEKQPRDLGVVSFKPRHSNTVYKSAINSDKTLSRLDKQEQYKGILHFVAAVEREAFQGSCDDYATYHYNSTVGKQMLRNTMPNVLSNGVRVKLSHSDEWL